MAGHLKRGGQGQPLEILGASSFVAGVLEGHGNTMLGPRPSGLLMTKVSGIIKQKGKKEMATFISECGHYLCRQRPTLPHTFACSTTALRGLRRLEGVSARSFARGSLLPKS